MRARKHQFLARPSAANGHHRVGIIGAEQQFPGIHITGYHASQKCVDAERLPAIGCVKAVEQSRCWIVSEANDEGFESEVEQKATVVSGDCPQAGQGGQSLCSPCLVSQPFRCESDAVLIPGRMDLGAVGNRVQALLGC